MLFKEGDDLLFHFTKKTIVMENILTDKILQFGNYQETADPQEYRNKIIECIFVEPRIADNIFFNNKHLIENYIFKNINFISCCRNTRDSSWLKPRMWSQYGGGHQGVCLIISKNKIIQELKNELCDDEYMTLYSEIHYIDYQESDCKDNERIKLKPSYSYDDLVPIILKHIEKYQRRLLFTKYSDYKDEEEFRIIVINKKICGKKSNAVESIQSPAIQVDIKKIIKGLILGDKFHNCYTPTIKKLIYELEDKTPIYKMRWGAVKEEYYLGEI